MRTWWLLLVPVALLAGCSNDSKKDGGADTTVPATSAGAETTAPLGTLDNVFAGADVDAICDRANQAAGAVDAQVGRGTHDLTGPEQLLYFQLRAGVVDVMVASLQGLQGDQGVDIAAAVTALGAYRAWTDTQANAIQSTGATVPEDDGGLLDTARQALGGSGACGDLFASK